MSRIGGYRPVSYPTQQFHGTAGSASEAEKITRARLAAEEAARQAAINENQILTRTPPADSRSGLQVSFGGSSTGSGSGEGQRQRSAAKALHAALRFLGLE